MDTWRVVRKETVYLKSISTGGSGPGLEKGQEFRDSCSEQTGTFVPHVVFFLCNSVGRQPGRKGLLVFHNWLHMSVFTNSLFVYPLSPTAFRLPLPQPCPLLLSPQYSPVTPACRQICGLLLTGWNSDNDLQALVYIVDTSAPGCFYFIVFLRTKENDKKKNGSKTLSSSNKELRKRDPECLWW